MDRNSQFSSHNDPSHPAMRRENWREGGGVTTAQAPTKPPVEPTESPTQTIPFPPYHDLLSGGSNMGPAASYFDTTNIPKFWNPPLTCFYWHSYGYCNKSDVDCLYAHYNTGIVASAPFARAGAQAGVVTMKHSNEHWVTQKELKDREAGLFVREKQLEDRVASVVANEAWVAAREKEISSKYPCHQGSNGYHDVIRGIYEVIDDTKAALNDAFDTLSRRTQKPKAEKTAEIADHAAGDVANAIVLLQRVETKAESKFARPAPLSGRVLTNVNAAQS